LDLRLTRLRRRVERSLAASLEVRDFDGGETLLETGITNQLRRDTGYASGGSLPAQAAAALGAWRLERTAEVATARTAARAALLDGMADWRDGQLIPRVDEHVAAGRWRSAIEALAVGSNDWSVVKDLDLRGLDEATRQEVHHQVMGEVTRKRLAILSDWRKRDIRLATAVRDGTEKLETALLRRETLDAVLLLAEHFRAACEDEGIAPDEEIAGVGTAFLEFEKATQRLATLTRDYRDQDARAGLLVLEERTAHLWAERQYGEIVRQWKRHEADGWREAVAGEMALRRLEAEHLNDLLERARRGAAAHTTGDVDLWLGGILYSGRFRTPEQGHPLVFDHSGGPRRLALAGDEHGELALATAYVVEQLADLAPPDWTERQRALVLALFRFREGDLKDATRFIEGSRGAGATDLGRDLRKRLTDALKQAGDEQEARDAWARAQFLRLKQERLHGTEVGETRGGDLALIGRLLDESRDAFSRHELEELREMRDAGLQLTDRERLEALSALLGPDSVESLPGDRVRMRFTFDRLDVGAWKSGDWTCDGLGWVGPARPASDEELLRGIVPRLAFGESLDLSSGILDLELEVEQLRSSGPPEALVISAAGFYAVLVGATENRGPLCLVDTTSAADVLERTRAGHGQPFAGLRKGARHHLRLVVHQANGWARVSVDGKEIVYRSILSSPRDRSGSASVSLRSWEPVRLLSATVVGGF
jgi:hypothetical protein